LSVDAELLLLRWVEPASIHGPQSLLNV
jgi:hypothetical protein